MQIETNNFAANLKKIPQKNQNPRFENSFSSRPKLPDIKYQLSENSSKKRLSLIEGDCLLETANFSIHLVSSFKQRIKASTLIKRMYATRGYQTESTSVFSDSPNQYTFEARNAQQLLGTLTLTVDSGNGLLADQLYKNEIDTFRNEGRNVCEVSKLAFTPNTSSKQIFAALFHIAYMYARFLHGVETAVIEINPRHVRFYKSTLGFSQIGDQRTCPRVDAPAILLGLDLNHMGDQIAQHAGLNPEDKGKLIYPHFLISRVAKQVLNKIIQIHSATRQSHTKTEHLDMPLHNHNQYQNPKQSDYRITMNLAERYAT
ncbi:MAG TPA: long-chain N-acyl amino acid synthase [Nitrosomonas mobilis]|nr:long-chain N-acyl amino acid synthase [Nitrosomonas mobilis]